MANYLGDVASMPARANDDDPSHRGEIAKLTGLGGLVRVADNILNSNVIDW
jgi:hypothetical protein